MRSLAGGQARCAGWKRIAFDARCASASARLRTLLQQHAHPRPPPLHAPSPAALLLPSSRPAASKEEQHHQRQPRRLRTIAAAAQQPSRSQQQDEEDGGGGAGSGRRRRSGEAAPVTTTVVSTPEGDVKVGAFLSRAASASDAVREAVAAIRAGLEQGGASASGGGSSSFEPELAIVFATAAHGDGLEDVVPALREAVPSLRHVFGCTSFGVLGSTPDAAADVEGAPGLSLTLAQLPGTEISVTHTLRSGIPDEDAPPQHWADLVGLPALGDARAAGGSTATSNASTATSTTTTSFLVLADPKFGQTRALLAGLDFAFPSAAKVGGVISSGQRFKRRAMYAWSAQGSGAPVAAGDRPRRRSPTQQMRGAAADEERGSAKARGQPSGGAAPQEERRGGLLGMLGRMLGGGGGGGGDGGNGGVADSGASERQGAWASADANGGDRDDSGLRMYGAAVLALRGNAYFDPITSQGYRAVSDRSWVVGRVSRDGAVIYSLVDPSASSAASSSAAAGKGGAGSDSDGEIVFGGGGGDLDDDEVPPLLALVDAMEAAGVGEGADGELTDGELEDLSNDRLWVAIAPDALAADADIGPDDFQAMKLTDFDEAMGAICVDGEVRTGYRLKLVLRDPEGVRSDLATQLLALKREDLAAALSGTGARPPAAAALVFVDLERGASLHGEEGYEAGRVGAFLPVPLGGMFAAAEVSTTVSRSRRATLYELATVAAVLRVAPVPDPSSTAAAARAADAEAAQKAGDQQQQEQEQEQQTKSTADGQQQEEGKDSKEG